MAIDTKRLFAQALIELCKTQPLESITVGNLSEKTGASRATFYNHFYDKSDLIEYVFSTVIVDEFVRYDMTYDEVSLRTDFYRRMLPYRSFLSQAMRDQKQNNLRDYYYQYVINWYTDRLEKKMEEIPENLLFTIRFISYGIANTFIQWVTSGMKEDPEVIARYVSESIPESLKAFFGEKGLTE